MVDIHSHVLPAQDDGSETFDESLEMLQIAAEDGVTDIVASPHCNVEYSFDPAVVDRKIAELNQAIESRDSRQDRIRVHRGCDFFLSYENILDALNHPDKYAINQGRYILVEFSDLLIPETTDDLFGRLLDAGLVPIVTHPERNPILRQKIDRLASWTHRGILLQVTGFSLLGRFGRHAKAFSDQLLRRNLVHVVASDAHDTRHRPPRLREAYDYVARTAGLERADALFVANPATILTGDPILRTETVVSRPRRWFQFWS